MKKTDKMATIGQFNPLTGNMVHFERRVWEDSNGIMHVKVGGSYISLGWLWSHGRDVDIW